MWPMVRVGFFEEFAYNGRLVQGFVVVLKGGHKSAGIEVDEGVRFIVWIHLDLDTSVNAGYVLHWIEEALSD
jgi:hypothetical protein